MFSSVFRTRPFSLRLLESFLKVFLFISHTEIRLTSRDVNEVLLPGFRENREVLFQTLNAAISGPQRDAIRQIGVYCWLLLARSYALNVNQNSSQTQANSRWGAATLNFCLLTRARLRAHTRHAGEGGGGGRRETHGLTTDGVFFTV